MERLNFNVSPKWNQERCDIVEILYLENEENLINFATSIQESGPVIQESYLLLEKCQDTLIKL